jgi:hypothetical protein
LPSLRIADVLGTGLPASVTANPSLERTRNGRLRWPRSAVVQHAPRGQRSLPLRAAQLKRQASHGALWQRLA